MTKHPVGCSAQDVEWSSLDGKEFSLTSPLKDGLVVPNSFKASSTACQFVFPFLHWFSDRTLLHAVQSVGISQDNQRHTLKFNKTVGATVVALLDQPPYPVSNA